MINHVYINDKSFSSVFHFDKKKTSQEVFHFRGPTWARTKDHLIMSQVL